jgi:hypothetical protein
MKQKLIAKVVENFLGGGKEMIPSFHLREGQGG